MSGVVEAPGRSLPLPGEVLLEAGLAADALPFIQKECEKNPEVWHHWSNLGIAYRVLMQFDEAKQAFKRAIELKEDAPEAWSNLGVLLEDFGKFEEARKAHELGFALAPRNRQAALNLSTSLLRMKEFEKAWPLWEVGRVSYAWYPVPGLPIWTGEELAGKRLLVTKEGGYGDTFMFLRYFRQLKEMGAEVTLYVWDRQAEMLVGHPWIDWLVLGSGGVDPTKYDFQVSVLSLPAVFGERYENLKPLSGYLKAEPELVHELRQVVKNGSALGLCWTAEESAVAKKIRSIDGPEIKLLKDVQANWYSLVPKVQPPPWVKEIPGSLSSWRHTAAFIESLDAVVTVDTAVAHLAAALGKPTYVILPINSDWKWFIGDDKSVWYETVTLVRNTSPYTFEPALSQLCEMLARQVI